MTSSILKGAAQYWPTILFTLITYALDLIMNYRADFLSSELVSSLYVIIVLFPSNQVNQLDFFIIKGPRSYDLIAY